MCVVVIRDARRRETGSTYKGNQWRARRDPRVAVRLGGPTGLSVAGYSVRDGELFLDRFPGWVDACVGWIPHVKGSLTYVTVRRTVRTSMVVLGIQRVRSRNKMKVGLPLAKSFNADLGGNESNHSNSRQQSRLQTKSSLRLDSRYNTAFIHIQTVLRKRYISGYVSYIGVLRVIPITSHQSAQRGHQSAHESVS